LFKNIPVIVIAPIIGCDAFVDDVFPVWLVAVAFV
jgi:hypothetical protein